MGRLDVGQHLFLASELGLASVAVERLFASRHFGYPVKLVPINILIKGVIFMIRKS